MPFSPRLSYILKISLASISFLSIAIYLFSSSSVHLTKLTTSLPTIPNPLNTNHPSQSAKTQFIDALLADDNEIDGAFNNQTLVELCKSKKWMPGLIFKCEPPEGGIANVRNVLLNCVRFAIEAGGSSFSSISFQTKS